MKLHEIAQPQQLDEVNWRKALATGAVAASAMLPGSTAQNDNIRPPTPQQQAAMQTLKRNQGIDNLTKIVLQKYKVNPEQAKQIATLAQDNAKATFPKAADILAIVGIESSFRPEAVSGLAKDPARGLMQVRPKATGLAPDALDSIEQQIQAGTNILSKYYDRLKSVPDAVHAYNIGIGNFIRQTKMNPKYIDKFNAERDRYSSVSPTM